MDLKLQSTILDSIWNAVFETKNFNYPIFEKHHMINGRSCISKGITSPITIEIMVPFETIELWGLLKHSRMSYGLLAFHNINNPNCFADMAKSIVNLIKQNEKGVR